MDHYALLSQLRNLIANVNWNSSNISSCFWILQNNLFLTHLSETKDKWLAKPLKMNDEFSPITTCSNDEVPNLSNEKNDLKVILNSEKLRNNKSLLIVLIFEESIISKNDKDFVRFLDKIKSDNILVLMMSQSTSIELLEYEKQKDEYNASLAHSIKVDCSSIQIMKFISFIFSVYYIVILVIWISINESRYVYRIMILFRRWTVLQRFLSLLPLLKMTESLASLLIANEWPFKSPIYISYLSLSKLLVLFAFEIAFVSLWLIISLGIKIARNDIK